MEQTTKISLGSFESLAIILGIILGILIVVGRPIIPVPAGEVKVVTRFGGVTGKLMEPGLNFKYPWPIESTIGYNTKMLTYETSPENKHEGSNADYKDFPVDTNTSDGQEVDISYTIRFSTDPTRATWCAQNVGSEASLVEKMVKTESRIWFRNIPRKYTAELLYAGEGAQQVQNEIYDILQPKFKDTCLVLDTVGIREIKFPPAFIKAISEKQIAKINIVTEENKAKQELHKKTQKITAAEAAAEAQLLQQQTLTPLLVEKYKIDAYLETLPLLKEKWNGAYPLVLSGDDQGILMSMPLPTGSK